MPRRMLLLLFLPCSNERIHAPILTRPAWRIADSTAAGIEAEPKFHQSIVSICMPGVQ